MHIAYILSYRPIYGNSCAVQKAALFKKLLSLILFRTARLSLVNIPTEPTKPAKSTKPGKPTKPCKPTKPAKPTKPGKPTQPTRC